MVCFPLYIVDKPPSILLIEGVRSHEAKKIMKEKMKLGDKVRLAEFALTERLEANADDQVLFYHSNTKEPGTFPSLN